MTKAGSELLFTVVAAMLQAQDVNQQHHVMIAWVCLTAYQHK